MGSWPSDQDWCPGLHPITQVGKWPGGQVVISYGKDMPLST